VFRRRRPPTDFSAEVEAHLQLEADRLRAEGVPEADAAAAARRAFGNVLAAEERYYESGRWSWADDLVRDVGHAARTLRRAPAFTAVASLSLALGIGANAAIFSFLDALLLRPYPFPKLESLVVVAELHPQQGTLATVRPSDPGHPLAPADFLDLRREARRFEALAAFRSRDYTLVGEGEPERLAGRLVSPELFALLGVGAAHGRTFLADEAQPGRDAVVLLSHGLWQRRLGGAPDVMGRSIVLNGRPHTVVGVMPPSFSYPPGGVELWTPLAFGESDQTERRALSVAVVGRLAAGASLDSARDDLLSVASRLERAYPATNTGRIFRAVPLREQQAGMTRPFAALFQGAAALVLLIACANVGGVLLARGLARRREMALRAALGAGGGRLARQLLAESVLLSALGLALALGIAAAGVRALRAGVPPDITKWVAGWADIRLDGRALAFAGAVALLTAVATGLRPALGAARLALRDVLREGGRVAAPGRRGRGLVVVGQMALALALLAGASLLVRGFGRLLDRYEGLRPSGLVTFRLRLPEARYPPGRAVADFYTRLADDLGSLPGVAAAATVAHLPGDLGPVPAGALSVLGRSAPGDLDLPVADHQPVTSGYFGAMGLRMLAGRALAETDGPETPAVAVVSESLARRLWPGGGAVGQRVKMGRPDDPGPWREVVGVVEDVTQYWFDREPRSTLYVPQTQAPRLGAFVVVRSAAGDPTALLPALRARVAALDSLLPMDEVRTLRRVVDDGMAILRLSANLMLLLGGVAVLLSALGIYGVVAEDVAQRTPELGVRLALGASRAQVARLVLSRALRLGAFSLLLGVPAAVALGRLMAGGLFGVVRPDLASLLALSAGLLAAALAAGFVPARRAAALDPAAVLRGD
jgi:putative ABC transport system permease protein